MVAQAVSPAYPGAVSHVTYQRNFMLTWPTRPGPALVTRPKLLLL
ncbi:hypothetical protein SBA4_3340001 [Candidatus Sulfopaludibacter sp. SbA4]|nr:hypothetical protein SBA4_3340001 [Candidatus Sulfopaludibacter sp. SbA4]